MIVIGSDHGGLNLKTALKSYLSSRQIQLIDVGTDNGDSVDYPEFGLKVAEMVTSGKAELGILICGTGIGMSIAANKVPGIRAALVTDTFMARMSKEHNNANVLVLGGRILDEQTACELVAAWLDATFEGGRHQGRLNLISEIEKNIVSSLHITDDIERDFKRVPLRFFYGPMSLWKILWGREQIILMYKDVREMRDARCSM